MIAEMDELKAKLAACEQKILSFEERKQKFLAWIEHGEPNQVFKRLYKRKFAEFFEDIERKI